MISREQDLIRIAMTIDQEWCPVPVLDWLLERLAQHDIKVTFFATDSPHMDLGDHEVAIHPNSFRPGSNSPEDEVKRLLDIYPTAKGLRMHRLAWEAGLESVAAENALEYVSTHLIPNQKVEPFRLGGQLLFFPIFYMDHHELLNPSSFRPSFSCDSLNMQGGGLFVFDFHPNMLFTNAATEAFYRNEVHPRYQDAKALNKIRNPGRGCCHLFDEILSLACQPDVQFQTLAESHLQFTADESHT